MNLLSSFLLFVSVLAVTSSDQITSLPGWKGELPTKQYSGYLDIIGGNGASNGSHLHYWHVESENDPSNDPLVFWFNGGPGCSSMAGFFTENGPFLINKDLSLKVNPGSWTTFSNMVFIESPAGAGYSYADDSRGYNHNDTSVAIDNFNAVKEFLAKFPQYKGREVYLTGESYAGIYVPTLSYQIIKSGIDINLAGIMVGNGCIGSKVGGCSAAEGGFIDIEFMHNRALISNKVYNSVISTCGNDWTSFRCELAVAAATSKTGPIDIYNIYYPCASNNNTDQAHVLSDPEHPNFPWFAPPSIVDKAVVRQQGPQACFVDNDPLTIYLNTDEVRRAINISPAAKGEWRVCGPRVGGDYQFNYDSTEEDLTKEVYPAIIQSSTRVLVYNGDVDLCVPYNGNVAWTSTVGEKLGVKEEWRPWVVDSQVAGYVTSYANDFTFATVKGAGHEVPQYKPLSGVALAERFIKGQAL